MSWRLDCPRLGTAVELTDERYEHIASRHPDLLPEHLNLVAETLYDPDAVDEGRAAKELVFRRWYDFLHDGKNVLVFVLRDSEPERFWIVTSRLSRVRMPRGTT